jgi:hypothetical protein
LAFSSTSGLSSISSHLAPMDAEAKEKEKGDGDIDLDVDALA